MTGRVPALERAVFESREVRIAGVVECESADGLEAIGRPEVDLVIWRRSLSSDLEAWLDRLAPVEWPNFRVEIDPCRLRQPLSTHLDAVGVPSSDTRDRWIADMQRLASQFAKIVGSSRVSVRLECISDNACWRFHRDCVEARLLTTYHGPATEWVHPDQAGRALSDQTDYTGPIERLGLHAVALFKGSCAGSGSGIVHRSPPIAGTGCTRLVLCLNKPVPNA